MLTWKQLAKLVEDKLAEQGRSDALIHYFDFSGDDGVAPLIVEVWVDNENKCRMLVSEDAKAPD